MVRPLKQWLLRHRHNPYPTKAEKVELAVGSHMSLVQVSNWFANARRRLKNVVQDPRCRHRPHSVEICHLILQHITMSSSLSKWIKLGKKYALI